MFGQKMSITGGDPVRQDVIANQDVNRMVQATVSMLLQSGPKGIFLMAALMAELGTVYKNLGFPDYTIEMTTVKVGDSEHPVVRGLRFPEMNDTDMDAIIETAHKIMMRELVD